MSTEHQQYSIANQSGAIALYAAAQAIRFFRDLDFSALQGNKFDLLANSQFLSCTI